MKILTLTLSAVDLETQRNFYCRVLGLREAEPPWTGRLSVQVGRTQLNFIAAPADWRVYYHFAFTIPPGRLEAAARWLHERATLIASPQGETRFFHESFRADALYFRDPAGNILELVSPRASAPDAHPADSANAGELPFNMTEISAVCEIGLAVSSVSVAVAEITERMPGTAPIEDLPAGGDISFAAVGDPVGRLIVVRSGRIWFPNTGVPAIALPLEVLVEVQEGNTLQRRYRLTVPPEPFHITPAG